MSSELNEITQTVNDRSCVALKYPPFPFLHSWYVVISPVRKHVNNQYNNNTCYQASYEIRYTTTGTKFERFFNFCDFKVATKKVFRLIPIHY